MKNIKELLSEAVIDLFGRDFGVEIKPGQLTFNETPKEFSGDITLVIFPLLRYTKQNPEISGKMIGEALKNIDIVDSYNVVKGFLNISISNHYWVDCFLKMYQSDRLLNPAPKSEKVLIEYSSPNTNKPLHLGHVRNNVLGVALSGLLEAAGYDTHTCNLINDRGIHICKSMLAWQKAGGKDTPESTGLKGDKLVGHFYVEFDKALKKEAEPLLQAALSEEWNKFSSNNQPEIKEAVKRYKNGSDNKKSELLDNLKTVVQNTTSIMQEARTMLQQWEAGDKDVTALWRRMNGWVYEGFEVTYRSLGVTFDKTYYESDTYLLGKDIVQKGLNDNILYQKEDGSVWINLEEEGLDQKLLLRSDGTSVYMTQDLGTADLRYDDFGMDRAIYVVGNEQEYHFKVLQLILKKLGKPYADGIYHFSYGMVDLPSGKMKSREGTVVDADDLIQDMIETAHKNTDMLGKTEGFTEEEAQNLYKTLGIGALKFYLLRVDPRKRILFNPEESIDLHGYTGPFVQYSYARIQSIIRRYLKTNKKLISPKITVLEPVEKELIQKVSQFQSVVELAAKELNPAKLIDYIYELAKNYNKFYSEVSIFGEDETITQKRVALSHYTGKTIKEGFGIMGISVPDRM